MSRYIALNKVLSELGLDHKDYVYIDKHEVAERIKKIPSIDIEPKRGEWIEENGRVICSECRRNALRTMTGCLMDRHLDYNKSDFCPNCGARMKGADDER